MRRRGRRVVWLLAALSLVCTTVEMLTGHLVLRLDFSRFAVLVGLAIAAEALFVMGLLLIAVAAGQVVSANPGAWLHVRRNARDQLQRVGVRPLSRVGLYLNWAGASGTALVLIAAIVMCLPPASWGLAAVPVADLAATFALRLRIRASLLRREAL